MNESDFSWFKILSFGGAALLLFIAIVVIASGIYLIQGDQAFHGVICIAMGLFFGGCSVFLYKNYQKKSDEKRYGKK